MSAACSLVVSSLSIFLIYVVQTRIQSLVLSCVFSGVSVICWNSLDVLGTELYPTQLRYVFRTVALSILVDLFGRSPRLCFQVLCSRLLHRSGPSGGDHGQYRLWKAGGHKLCCSGAAGVGSAANGRTGCSHAPADQTDGAHLTPPHHYHHHHQAAFSHSQILLPVPSILPRLPAAPG